MLTHNLVLKSNELYLAGSIATDGSGELATGLYARDTRHLNRFRLTLDGEPLQRLQVILGDLMHARVITANRGIHRPGAEPLLPLRVLVEQAFALDTDLVVTLTLRNFTQETLRPRLGIEAGADFRDLFDIRGYARERRGTWREPVIDGRGVTFGYTGLDAVVLGTILRFDREPASVEVVRRERAERRPAATLPGLTRRATTPELDEQPIVAVAFETAIPPGGSWELAVTVTPSAAEEPAIAPAEERSMARARVVTDHGGFNRSIRRSLIDLDALQTSFPDGELPAAGIPWFVAPFGRDSLIVGLQTLHLMPERAAATLRALAGLQGTRVDPAREEEPGKILHEMRYGEMARRREVPHSPYYGSVDATPLFVWLLAETVAWTGDRGLFDALVPHARRALDWVDQYGDRDGDGLVEYPTDRDELGHITHQVWKDSFDSAHHADGSVPPGPIAAVEVQGYVYAACDRLARVAAWAGDGAWAEELRARAERVRMAVEQRFWIEPLGFYAQGLDGEKRPIAQITSNPGHLLLAGLPAPERARAVIARLRAPALWSGWGVRTLSAEERSYNPMSYHNGSVWPHDNSLIGAGCYRYGEVEAGRDILRGMMDAARSDALHRLPELFCGFARTRRPDEAPVPYPVSCSPQAWAAGALLLFTRAFLGLEPDPSKGRLRLSPNLPDWIHRVTIDDMNALGQRGSLTVERDGDGYRVQTIGLPVDPAVEPR